MKTIIPDVARLVTRFLSLAVLMHFAAMISPSGFAADSTNAVGNLPAAKWDFERSDGLSMKKCSICDESGRGKCLRLVSSASRATAKTAASLPDVASPKTPYTLAIWLSPDKSMISDADVEMARFGGRRMTKFASAMHDGKWHHLAVTYDPAAASRSKLDFSDCLPLVKIGCC